MTIAILFFIMGGFLAGVAGVMWWRYVLSVGKLQFCEVTNKILIESKKQDLTLEQYVFFEKVIENFQAKPPTFKNFKKFLKLKKNLSELNNEQIAAADSYKDLLAVLCGTPKVGLPSYLQSSGWAGVPMGFRKLSEKEAERYISWVVES